MGVIYKLKPEISAYVLEQKKTTPNLSCRQLSMIIFEKFQIKLSKSSVNSLIKRAGLSMPVGRRLKKRRRKANKSLTLTVLPVPYVPPEVKAEKIIAEPATIQLVEVIAEQSVKEITEIPCNGLILLKAVDYLLGGSYLIAEAIKGRLNQSDKEILPKVEGLIYASLSLTWPEAYLSELQQVIGINTDIMRVISQVFQEVRCIKLDLSDHGMLYIDGQAYTAWPVPYAPYYFNILLYRIKTYANKYINENIPFIFLTAPGHENLSEEFFDFIFSMQNESKKLSKLTFYGNIFEELDVVNLTQLVQKRFFLFGLWPRQFERYRNVKKIGEFRPFCFELSGKVFYIADAEVELFQPVINKSITLRGCALKTSLVEKVNLIILSNLSAENASLEDLVKAYLDRWPDPEEALQDYKHKVEFFTYTGDSYGFSSVKELFLGKAASDDLKSIFGSYSAAMNLYFKWYFLPSGYENFDFQELNERFYTLSAKQENKESHVVVTLQPPVGYKFISDLKYICNRLNEKQISTPDRKRIWFKV